MAALDLGDFPGRLGAAATPLTDPDAALAGAPAGARRPRRQRADPRASCARGDAGGGAGRRPPRWPRARVATAFVEHAYIEPEAGVAWMEGDTLVIRACTQAPVMDRDDVATVLGLPPERVRIIPPASGGGFGSKLDLSVQPLIGLGGAEDRAALPDGLYPRRIACSRRPSATRRGCRPRIGCDADGPAHRRWPSTASSTPAPMPAGGRPWRTACRSMPRAPTATPNYRAERVAVHTHNPRRRRLPRLRRAAGGDRAGDALRRSGRRRRDRPAGVPQLNACADGDATVCGQVLAGRRHPRLPRRAAPRWARGAGRGGGVQRAPAAAAARRRRRRLLVRLRQHRAAQPLDHPGRADARRAAGAASGRDGHRPGVEHRHRPDLRRRAGRCRWRSSTLVGADTALTPDAGKTSASRQTFVTGKRGAAGRRRRCGPRSCAAPMPAGPRRAIALGRAGSR